MTFNKNRRISISQNKFDPYPCCYVIRSNNDIFNYVFEHPIPASFL